LRRATQVNLKTRSSLAVVGILLLVFGAGVVIQDYLVRHSLQKTIAEQQFALVSRFAAEVSNRVDVSLGTLKRVASGLDFRHTNDPDRLRNYLHDNQGALALFEALIIVSPSLTVLADNPARPGRLGADVSSLEHLRRVVETGAPIVSRPFVGVITGQPLLAMSVPVFDSLGNLIAIVSGTLDILSPAFLGGINRGHSEMHGQFVLTTRERTTIVGDNSRLMLSSYAEPGVVAVYDRAVAGWEGTEQGVDPGGRRMLMSFRTVDSLDWIAGVVLPVEQAFAPIARSQRVAILLLLVASLLVGLLVWFAMRGFLRPLFELRDNVVALRSDPSRVHALPVGEGEVGEVASDFYRLFDELSRSREESVARAEELQSVLDASPIAIVMLREHRVMMVNPAFERMFVCAAANAIERSLEPYFEDHAAFIELCRKVEGGLEEARVLRFEQRFLDSRGQWFWAYVYVRALDPARPERGLVMLIEDISEQKLSEERIRHMAEHDPLTDLPNRMLFNDRAAQALARSRREHRRFALLFLDLDRFKNINDTLGHHVGDQLLRVVAGRILACVRESDTVSRPGGDEFSLLLSEISDPQDAARVAEKLLVALAEPCEISGRSLLVTASIGISLYPEDGDDIPTLMRNADSAMYHSKESGRNAYHYFRAEMNERVFERMMLESALRNALEADAFEVYYQPQYDGTTRRMIGAEALLRWRDQDGTLVPPGRFIPIAEDAGLILPIGQWVLQQVCGQLRAWLAAGLPALTVAVNISASQFRQPRFVDSLRAVIEQNGIPAECLELELTERVMLETADRNIAALDEIRRMGVGVAIDDFGTGYSSLSYLKRLPIDTLKIDQGFVRDVVVDPDDAAIVDAVIGLAHNLRLRVIAEGVETEEQLEFLQRAGCRHMQGFLFAPALPASEFERLWREGFVTG
jgi:diguanylate cyclase (GGDEF)-like protein/PAS domain S-box-containing protein